MARALTYKDAGVDIEAGDRFAKGIQPLMRRTFGPRVIEMKGGFAGLCRLDKMGLLGKRLRDPVLAACADGVGTKLKIAFMMDKHDTVGIDLVAMNVNDLTAVGAEPLYFLDYIATGKLAPGKMTEIVKGISDGCVAANCALLGGETAEMADFYAAGEYDLAGFATGVVECRKIIDGKRIEPKDVVIGVASSGLHSNGYSLARKIFFQRAKMSVSDPVDDFGCTLGEELLRPTRIYVAAVRAVLHHYRVKNIVHGIAHITGGGIAGNVARLLPKNCRVVIKEDSWPVPPVFAVIQKLGRIDKNEMFHTFNMGVGMILIVPNYNVNVVMRILKRHGETSRVIGEVRQGKRGVVLRS